MPRLLYCGAEQAPPLHYMFLPRSRLNTGTLEKPGSGGHGKHNCMAGARQAAPLRPPAVNLDQTATVKQAITGTQKVPLDGKYQSNFSFIVSRAEASTRTIPLAAITGACQVSTP